MLVNKTCCHQSTATDFRMIREDDTYVIHGPKPLQPIPKISLGKLVYHRLLEHLNKGEALVDAVTGDSISYKEILGKTCSLAETLSRKGYGKNTVVSIISENNLQFYIPVISCLYIGAIVAPVNYSFGPQESFQILNVTKPRIIFCSKAVCQKYIALKTELHYLERIIIIDSEEDVEGAETLNQFINITGFPLLNSFPVADLDPDKQIAFVMASSGTTGLPKGVALNHTNFMVRHLHTMDERYTVKTEHFLGILPFFHAFGMVTNFFALVEGQKIVVIRKFEEKVFFKAIQDYKISVLMIPPPLVIALAKSPLAEKYDLSSIKDIMSGAAPLGKDIEELVKRKFNIDSVRQAYGLTECTLAVLMNETEHERHGSSGKVVTYMSCKVRDPETGKSLGPRQVGELCFKGPMVMMGYYGNEEVTKNSFTPDGWLLTGDLAYYDEDQYFYVVDRLKELIKYKAFQVPPAELEAILLSHPKIQDVGVVGLPDEDAGELPLAFVVKRPNVELTEQEVKDFAAERVSSQKKLRGGVIFVRAIPKNLSGKILRRELRYMLGTHMAKL